MDWLEKQKEQVRKDHEFYSKLQQEISEREE